MEGRVSTSETGAKFEGIEIRLKRKEADGERTGFEKSHHITPAMQVEFAQSGLRVFAHGGFACRRFREAWVPGTELGCRPGLLTGVGDSNFRQGRPVESSCASRATYAFAGSCRAGGKSDCFFS